MTEGATLCYEAGAGGGVVPVPCPRCGAPTEVLQRQEGAWRCAACAAPEPLDLVALRVANQLRKTYKAAVTPDCWNPEKWDAFTLTWLRSPRGRNTLDFLVAVGTDPVEQHVDALLAEVERQGSNSRKRCPVPKLFPLLDGQ